jgi:hypothetical protein
VALHPPSQYRALVQEAKHGRTPPAQLVEEGRNITDPSFAAEALFFLSGDARIPITTAGTLLDEAFKRVEKTEREWRKAEVLADWAARGAKWREGEAAAAPHRRRLQEALSERAAKLQPGKPRSQLLQALGKWRPDAHAARLLEAALRNGETAATDAKAILRAGSAPGLGEVLDALPDAGLRARLLAFLHQHGGGPVLDKAVAATHSLEPRVASEALRAIIASLEEPQDLDVMRALLPPHPETRARALAALATRADKLGDASRARKWFAEGLAATATISDGATRDAVRANLEEGLFRVGGKPKAVPATPGDPGAAERLGRAAAPARGRGTGYGTSARRHMLALCDTYEGGLGETHLRAIARAAPLCWAFDLDLALLGFPTKDLERLVRQAGKETAIGDGGRHVGDLAREGRIHLVECDATTLPDWRGIGVPVATTPEPDPAKAIDLAAALQARAGGRLVLIMGLGKHGLPAAWLKAIPYHYEITGRRVSLETATAMGILAERLRAVGDGSAGS